jgi:hypothetical protein
MGHDREVSRCLGMIRGCIGLHDRGEREEISPDLPDLWLVKSRSSWTIPAKRLGGASRPVTGRF